MVAAMVPIAAASSHSGIFNHHHRSQILPNKLTHLPLTSSSLSIFRRYLHQSHHTSSLRIRGKLNAAYTNPTAAAGAATTSSETSQQPPSTQEYTIDDILNKVQEHACLFNTKQTITSNNENQTHHQSLTLSGTGIQLGMEATWSLTIRSDGAFREHVSSPFVSFASGFNADFGENCAAWDIDSSGVCHRLQLDDHQATVLVTWIRTGVWSLPWLRSFLTIDLVDEANSIRDDTKIMNENKENREINKKFENFVILSVRLQSGQVAVHVKINTRTWQPESAKVIMCGDYETWEFENWKHWQIQEGEEKEKENGASMSTENKTQLCQSTVPCAQGYTHSSMNGGDQSLVLTNIELNTTTLELPITASPNLLASSTIDPGNSTTDDSGSTSTISNSSTIYENQSEADSTTTNKPLCYYSSPDSHPGVSLLPQDTRFLKDVSSGVPVWHTRSGHMLAFATLNGDESNSGYFIVDTGASGFVIEPSAADKLNLESFGSVHVTGLAGKIEGKFRRAKTFLLGPLEMKDAVLMEMSCGGLVAGAPGPVIGIVGFDVFRRAVVDIPPMIPRKATAAEEEERERERAAIMSPAAALAFAAMSKPKKNQNENPKTTDTPEPSAYIHLHHPEEAEIMLRSMLRPEDWLPVTMLSCLPHVQVTIQSKSTQLSSSNNAATTNHNTALLMVDTGAGGMATLLNPNAAKTLGLFDNNNGNSKNIRGIGGSQKASMSLKIAQLSVLKVGTAEFEGVQCLIAEESKGGVALSFYSSGILCGEILSQCRLVIDLPRGRMAILARNDTVS